MTDRRVTLVMTESGRDLTCAALSAALAGMDPQMERTNEVLTRHLERLREARVGSWGKR